MHPKRNSGRLAAGALLSGIALVAALAAAFAHDGSGGTDTSGSHDSAMTGS